MREGGKEEGREGGRHGVHIPKHCKCNAISNLRWNRFDLVVADVEDDEPVEVANERIDRGQFVVLFNR